MLDRARLPNPRTGSEADPFGRSYRKVRRVTDPDRLPSHSDRPDTDRAPSPKSREHYKFRFFLSLRVPSLVLGFIGLDFLELLGLLRVLGVHSDIPLIHVLPLKYQLAIMTLLCSVKR